MSELIVQENCKRAQGHLLASVSALVLLAWSGQTLAADDSDRPTVWIELGGQLEQVQAGQVPFFAPFLASPPPFVTLSPAAIQRSPRYATGAEGSISIMPEGTDWVLSATLRYGRSNGVKHTFQSQTVKKLPNTIFGQTQIGTFFVGQSSAIRSDFFSGDIENRESHALLDFTVGRDVGVGMLGRHSTSVFGFGVRFAQLSSNRNVNFRLRPDLHYYDRFPTTSPIYQPAARFHDYHMSGQSSRNFHGIGPTVFWDASTPFAGNADGLQLSVDWGVNAAILFGKQKALTEHATSGRYSWQLMYSAYASQYTNPRSIQPRSHTVIVPNIGGFVGLSLKFPNAKVSLGYRADFFFGAIDGGIDTRKSEDVSFHGPFATISVGLGG